MIPRIMIIAGSDSGGGAGIQADIKTVTMLGGHAMTAITAITAQNTLGVQAVQVLPADLVVAQIRSCADDIGVDAVKIGMLGSPEIAHAAADWLDGVDAPVVFDPVMVATSGSTLADDATIAAFERLMARATVVTPNLPELERLGGEAAVLAHAPALLVKGGHGAGATLTDRLVTRDGEAGCWTSDRIDTRATHGTGCTLASALAVELARGASLATAVARARRFVRLAMRDAPGLGGGHGPIGHGPMGHGPMGHGMVRLDAGPGARLNQVTVPSTDPDADVAFYRTLGLTQIVATDHGYARFEAAGGATLSLHAETAPTVFFECEDLDAEVTRLRAAGIAIAEPVEQGWRWREARLHDPSGNALCLYQAGENRRHPPWRLR